MSIVGSGKTNMLKLIIENDPSKLQISQVEHKMKTYERFYENSNVFKYTQPNVRNLYFKYNILYGTNSSNVIKTYLPKMRPISASVRSYSKYQLKKSINDGTIYNDCIFSSEQIEKLYLAKCMDLTIDPNDKTRKNFNEVCKVNCVNRIIDFRNCSIGYMFVKTLSEILINNRLINEISQIKLGGNPIGEKAIKYITNIIESSNSITYIDLSCINISYKIGDILFGCLMNQKSLISLNLSSSNSAYHNRLLSFGIKTIKEVLKKNHYLEFLSLSGNSIKKEGFKMLIEGINENQTLSEIDISNNDITSEGMKYIHNLTNKNFITSLNLSNNDIRSEGIIIFCKKILNFKMLRRLYLENCNITFKGFSAIVEAFNHGNRIEILKMDGNDLRDRNFGNLLEMMKRFNVTSLSLKGCNLGDSCAYSFGYCLLNNEIIKEINVALNNISDKGFSSFTSIPDTLRNLEKIDVSQNLITDESACEFIGNLKYNNSIKEINFFDNQLQTRSGIEMMKVLDTNRTIVNVNFLLNSVKNEITDNINMKLKRNREHQKVKFIPGLKQQIKNSLIDPKQYEVYNTGIKKSKNNRTYLEITLKQDEDKYERMKKFIKSNLEKCIEDNKVIENEVDIANKAMNKVDQEVEIEKKRYENKQHELLKLIEEMTIQVEDLTEKKNKLEKDFTFSKVDLGEEANKLEEEAKRAKDKV